MKVDETSSEDLNKIWNSTWKGIDINSKGWSTLSDISRDESLPWKLKYAPCHGTFLEAGSGVGQYVFYFNKLGFKIKGIDISEEAIKSSKEYSDKFDFDSNIFGIGDVRNLNFPSNSFTYYLSLGVVEHFKEGPQAALQEAYRVLKPGGLAFIGTPSRYSLSNSRSFIGWMFFPTEIPFRIFNYIRGVRSKAKGAVENLWSLDELKNYVSDSGFKIVDAQVVGLKDTFEINWRPQRKNYHALLKKIRPLLYPLLDFLERTFLKRFGLSNIVVAIKPKNRMHCFFCGVLKNKNDLGIGDFSIPFCKSCRSKKTRRILQHYKFKEKPFFEKRLYSKDKNLSQKEICKSCDKEYTVNPYFENHCFSSPTCDQCLADSDILLELRNFSLIYENSD